MDAVSTFTSTNYHCKPLVTDVIVIHNNKNYSLSSPKHILILNGKIKMTKTGF